MLAYLWLRPIPLEYQNLEINSYSGPISLVILPAQTYGIFPGQKLNTALVSSGSTTVSVAHHAPLSDNETRLMPCSTGGEDF